jgi:ribosomal protein L21/ribosomal protein L27
MYAIIETGGKQYRVEEGVQLDVELLNLEENQPIEFTNVLLVHDGQKVHVGSPTVTGAVVKAELESEVRGPKVIAFKYKRRKNERRKVGHRQNYLRVRISSIALA